MSLIRTDPAAAHAVTPPATHSRRRPRRLDLLRPVVIIVTARLMMTLVLRLAKYLDPTLVRQGWDSGWYVLAAQHGWPHNVPTTGGHAAASTLAFFPAFPVLIRAVHLVLPLSWARAGSGAAMLSELTMAVALWILARDIWDERSADRATLLLCFFPGAFIFALAYSEPLLITLAAVCLYALRKRHWELAGIAAALATATRPNGVALVACCAWEAYRALRARHEWRSLIAPVLAPIGLIAWFAYLWATTGTPVAWFRTEEGGWGERIQPLALAHLVADDLHHPFLYPNEFIPIIATLAVAALLVAFALSRRADVPSVLVVYTAVVLILSLMSKTLGLRPRFVLTAFPIILVLGHRLRDPLHTLVTSVFATLMAILLVLTVSTLALTP